MSGLVFRADDDLSGLVFRADDDLVDHDYDDPLRQSIDQTDFFDLKTATIDFVDDFVDDFDSEMSTID